MSPAAELLEVPFEAWDVLREDVVRAWDQGQHAFLLGATGKGKTTLLLDLLNERVRRRGADVVLFATKRRDDTLTQSGWPRLLRWPPGYGQDHVVFWPPYGDPETVHRRHAQEFRPVLRQLFAEGGVTAAFDEIQHLEGNLGLRDLTDQFWEQGRALKLTVVAATQRPRGVSRAGFANATWFYIWKARDDDEGDRLAEMGGGDVKRIREVLRKMQGHEFLVVNAETNEMVRSRMRRPRARPAE